MQTRSVSALATLVVLALSFTLASCQLGTNLLSAASPSRGAGSGDGSGDGDTTVTDPGTPPPVPKVVLAYLGADSLVTAGQGLHLAVSASNTTDAAATLAYSITGPAGWTGLPASGELTVPAHDVARRELAASVPAGTAAGGYELNWEVRQSAKVIASGKWPVWVVTR